MKNLRFHPQLVLRTPHEPFSAVLDENRVREYVQSDASFREALYLASPALLSAATSSPDLPEKLLLPLTRYLLRSRYRATPFGLFSGVSTVQWGSDTRLSLEEGYRQVTRLDMGYLCDLAQILEDDPRLRRQLIYYPNSSFYFLGEDMRYIERRGSTRLSAVKRDRYLKAVLEAAGKGAGFSSLLQTLDSLGVSQETGSFYLHELIDSQVLVSELEPVITGDEYASHVLKVLERANHSAAPPLRKALEKLSALHQDLVSYSEITSLLRELGEIPEKLFYTVRVNACKPSEQLLSRDYQADLLGTIHKLGTLAGASSGSMKTFISRFYDRYEEAEVPLLTALDSESGIGYPAPVSDDYTPLTEGITLPEEHRDFEPLKWKPGEELLFRCLQKAQNENLYEIALPLLESPPDELCPSLCVMFRLVDQDRLLLEHVGGSSATHLAGRFGNASADIEQILRDIASAENETNPEIIFAEIVHLPEGGRTGNILSRPAFRQYEIPYLAQSGLPPENQIHLQDIFVSVRDNRIILRHGKLNKRIIPRLGCAHNFRHQSLPVYRFLCDLQHQGFPASLDFSWGELANHFSFLPRVIDGRVIVSPAMWQLSETAPADVTEASFEIWCWEHKIPNCFVLAEGDNELFIDSTQPLHRRVFLDSIKGKRELLLKEFLGAESLPVLNFQGKAMVNQFIAFLTRTDTAYHYKEEKLSGETRRSFSPGSEWLYLKYYCGAKSADQLLLRGIAPLLQDAEEKGWIDQWFFIRYQDPENHLRVRFHLTDIRFLQPLLEASDLHLQPFLESGVLWKVQTDTYRRELERYGSKTMELSERLFYVDSRMYMDFLHRTEGDLREDLKWLWGLRNVDRILHAAGLDTDEKQKLMLKLRKQFAEEFNMNQDLKSQIDRRYRLHRARMEEFIRADDHSPALPPYFLWQLRKNWKALHAVGVNTPAFERILASIIHMSLNRLISSGQRLHELLMYDFLHRHYTSQRAREKLLRAS